jgi:hypothetical protein
VKSGSSPPQTSPSTATPSPPPEQSRVIIDTSRVLYGSAASWGAQANHRRRGRHGPTRAKSPATLTYVGGRASTRAYKVFFIVRFDTATPPHGTWTDGDNVCPLTGLRTQTSGAEVGAFLGSKIPTPIRSFSRHLCKPRPGPAVTSPPSHLLGTTTPSPPPAPSGPMLSPKSRSRAAPRRPPRARHHRRLRVHLTPTTGPAGPSRYGDGVYFETLLCLWDTFTTRSSPLISRCRPSSPLPSGGRLDRRRPQRLELRARAKLSADKQQSPTPTLKNSPASTTPPPAPPFAKRLVD